MKRPDGSWYTEDELYEKVCRLEAENDNLHERIRKLESAFEAEAEHVRLTSRDEDDLETYVAGLPV